MSEILKYEIEAICVVHIISIILAIVFFMMFYIKANKDYSTKAFLIMQISIIGWLVFKIFKTVSTTEISRWWFIVGYYFFACVFEVAFLEFTYAYYKGRPLKKKIRMLLYVFPIMQFLAIVTNPSHHLFYAKYTFWGDSFGVLFYVHTFIVYGFIAAGFFYGCLTFAKRFKGEKVWYKLLIASTIILPLIINILFITKVLHKFVRSIGIPVIFDITPIVFVFSTLVFVYATFNHEFINLSPMMRYEIVHRLDTPICVLDSSFDVIYINEKLEETLGEHAMVRVGESMKQIDVLRSRNKKKLIEIGDQVYTMLIRGVRTLRETQYLITLHNITDYKSIEGKIVLEQKALARTNQELEMTIKKLTRTSRKGARNYVARELHDIIGHSLVVTIKLLEVSTLYVNKDRELSTTALLDGLSSLESGINSLESITSKENTYTGSDLEKAIQKMLNRIKATEITTRLSFKGLHFNVEEKIYDGINRVCQELVTNSLKHAKAKKIFVSVNIKPEDITILVLDNGVGCEELVMGNGLHGIKERLKLINGEIAFITSPDEGFMSKVLIKG
ncbi:hypothetical protein SANA_14060 [Gottschalkiaceae bacterium SANA]|nr:hypothetical protein SANA_14060 [Gottschalkiaceae bacterium SANA]